MKKIGICLLAYGDEHIEECLFFINNLKYYKKDVTFYVGTDCVDDFKKISEVKVFKIDEPFNYNLKRISVKEAFKECDIIILMDTDIIEHVLYNGVTTTTKSMFKTLNDIEDGMYSDYFNVLNLKHQYQKKIYDLSDSYEGLLMMLEHIIILKITDEKVKKKFLENWELFTMKH